MIVRRPPPATVIFRRTPDPCSQPAGPHLRRLSESSALMRQAAREFRFIDPRLLNPLPAERRHRMLRITVAGCILLLVAQMLLGIGSIHSFGPLP